MAHYHFKKDLEDGHQAELEVIELLKRTRPLFKNVERCHTKEYDFRGEVWGGYITFEVKYDLMVEKTGNIAIEYESRGKPSGIATTKANFWVYKFLGRYFLYLTSELKKHLYEDKGYDRKATGGDKGSNTKMFLVGVEKFMKWGREVVDE